MSRTMSPLHKELYYLREEPFFPNILLGEARWSLLYALVDFGLAADAHGIICITPLGLALLRANTLQ